MADLFERILLLKRTPVFSAVMTGDLRLVAQELTEEAFFAGERVFDINDPSDRLYLITDGRIGISLHADPAVKDFIATLGPRECFGEMGLFDDQLRSATAHVLEDTRLLALDKGKLLGILQAYPALGLGVIRSLSERLRATNKKVS
ncbi:MAG: cyclic nucleotide-binding domain-containing protein [Pseudomonadota bacterium]|nr:MAG: cyclic nucleotide-binding domain-containing protein [Pseudomonadota bacterium]